MFNIHQMRIWCPKNTCCVPRRRAPLAAPRPSLHPPKLAEPPAPRPGDLAARWEPGNPPNVGFSWIFIDFTMNFTMNFTHKPWLKVGLLSEDFPHVPQKTHTKKKKSQSPGVHNQTVLPSLKNLPPPPAATSAGEAWLSQLLICLDGGTAALDTKRCLVASTQNTFDSQKLSDGKINLGLKIDNRTTFWNR